MDLHAVWDRIDQLEKVVMSQAREINHLKHVINSACPMPPQENQQQIPPKSNTLDSCHHLLYTQNKLHMTNHKRNATGRNSLAINFHPYSMNPVVHPTTAIPPINSQPMVADIEDRQTKSNYNKLVSSSLDNVPYGRSSLMMATGSKYSLHALNDIDQDSEDESSSNHNRHERQSFVENTVHNSSLPLSPPSSQMKDDTSLTLFCSKTSSKENSKPELIEPDAKMQPASPKKVATTCPILASSQGLASSSDDLMSYTIGEIVPPTEISTKETGPMPIYINVDASKKFRAIPLVHQLQAKKLKVDWPPLK